ncbi:MAG: DUF1295 domain-containing protein [Xanthomonadales bacterium]|nr:DUF1295 domain-containing protein [Xanthomonadales bacterium]
MIYLEVILICFALQTLAWIWQLKTNNADIVDLTWSVGIVICSMYYFLNQSPEYSPSYWMLIFPGLWYLRLSIHLLLRYDINHEDRRYTYLRRYWNKKAHFNFFWFFMAQALLIFIFSLPAYWLTVAQWSFNHLSIMALLIGIISLIGVTLADKQLLSFKIKNSGTKNVCDEGLWRYSRHPNYFFEWTHWFVYPILLYQTEYFLWSLIYPILMLIFLLKLTGIPYSEQQSILNRGDNYREYQNRTNKFFPWKPKTN